MSFPKFLLYKWTIVLLQGVGYVTTFNFHVSFFLYLHFIGIFVHFSPLFPLSLVSERKMEPNSTTKWFSFLIILLSLCLQLTQCKVTYDKKALIINGQRRILFSGSIHYPRSTPQVHCAFPFSYFPRKMLFPSM